MPFMLLWISHNLLRQIDEIGPLLAETTISLIKFIINFLRGHSEAPIIQIYFSFNSSSSLHHA